MRRNNFPELNELVLFKITAIDEIAVYGTLIEYKNISAMMIFAEVSARRIKSIYQHVKEGQEIVALVTQLDIDRGYINLSRKQVTQEDKQQFMIEYSNRKKVNTILYKLSLQFSCDIVNLYERMWILLDEYECLYIAFKCINKDNSLLDKVDINDNIKKELLVNIEKLCMIPLQNFCGEMKLHCFHPDGVDVIKDVLKRSMNDINKQLSVHYLAAPLYELRTLCYDSDSAQELFNNYVSIVNNYIKEKNGYCQFNRIITDKVKLDLVNEDNDENESESD
jgi:translation initiation factor 2 subunit 1